MGRQLLFVAGLLVCAPTHADSGKSVFERTCVTCHGKGVLGAPRFGSRDEWRPRIAQGRAKLYEHADSGYNAMPPHGGNDDLSDLDVQQAVDYMVQEAGGYTVQEAGSPRN